MKPLAFCLAQLAIFCLLSFGISRLLVAGGNREHHTRHVTLNDAH